MKACWDDLGDSITEAHIHDLPGCRPWFWWHAESPEPRDETKPEAEQLAALGLLTPTEQAALARRAELEPNTEPAARAVPDGHTATWAPPPRRWPLLPLPTKRTINR